MIDRASIMAWNEFVPWTDYAMVEQDLIISRALVDIFSDVKAFILAKTFAQYRGYKICIDGITDDKLKYIDRGHLSSDLIKIISNYLNNDKYI